MENARRERKGEIKSISAIHLNEEQKEAVRLIENNQIVVITGRAGCLSYGTKVLMYDGSYKEVQNIIIGDMVMGIDSTPRKVLSLYSGKQQMYWIRQNKGIDYRVNEDHILSLVRNIPAKYSRYTENNKRKFDFSKKPLKEKESYVINISVKDYLLLPKRLQNKECKGYICDTLNFKDQYLEIDPYYLGLWLGDGNRRSIRSITTSDNEIKEYLFSIGGSRSLTHKYEILLNKGKFVKEFNNIYNLDKHDSLDEKYIPKKYLLNSINNRLQLLAGILDSDGHYIEKGKYYDICLKDFKLLKDIQFLCGTLGFKTNFRKRISKMNRNDGSVYSCETYRLSIIPTNNLIIPIKIERKKHKIQSDFKNRKLTGIKIEKDIIDDYYGFELDGDNLFILEDFTVTHNSGKSLVGANVGLKFLETKQAKELLITRAAIEVGKSLGFLPGGLDDKFDPYMEAFIDNLYKCVVDKGKVNTYIEKGNIKSYPIQFIRGKTIEDVLIVEEAQNMTKQEMLAVLTRLGKTGKIIVNGDNEQQDTKESVTGLSYAIELSKKIEGVAWIKLKENHRSDLVGKILSYEYDRV